MSNAVDRLLPFGAVLDAFMVIAVLMIVITRPSAFKAVVDALSGAATGGIKAVSGSGR